MHVDGFYSTVLTELVQRHVKEVSNDFKLRHTDVLCSAEVVHVLFASLDELTGKILLLFFWKTRIQVFDEFNVQHIVIKF